MITERIVRGVVNQAWLLASGAFLFVTVFVLAVHTNGSSFLGLNFREMTAWAMRIIFGALLVLQLMQYMYARRFNARSSSSDLNVSLFATSGVALSAWLTFAMFFGLDSVPLTSSLQLVLSAFPACAIILCLLSFLAANNVDCIESVIRIARRNSRALALSVCALLIYISLMSLSLSEYDSINFSQALRRYDLTLHQPHPPGYSLYVFLGRCAVFLTGKDVTALTLVSAVSGALGLLPVFVITAKMYDGRTAIVTSLALMSTRMYWLSSEKAVTNMLATFLMTLAVCLLYLGLKGNGLCLLASWPAVGLALGARPSMFPFLVLWIYGIIRERDLKRLPVYIMLLVCSTFSWLIPIILHTGWNKYGQLVGTQYDYIATEEFVGARHGLQPVIRLYVILAGLASSGFGTPIQLAYPYSSPLGFHTIPSILIASVLLLLTILVIIPRIRQGWSERKTFFLLWIVPHFLFVYFACNPSYPRYFLPIMPPMVIALVSTAWTTARSMRKSALNPIIRQKLLYSAVIVLIIFNSVNSARLAVSIHTTEVPTIRLTKYIKNNYDQHTTVIVFHEYKAFQYFLPNYRYLNAQYDQSAVATSLDRLSKSNDTVLITETAIRYVLASMIQAMHLRKTEVARFEIDPHVETEEHLIILYRLQSANPQG